jgi:murein DD-endopeptidase MepM/ murein hydrolase activator NlpD
MNLERHLPRRNLPSTRNLVYVGAGIVGAVAAGLYFGLRGSKAHAASGGTSSGALPPGVPPPKTVLGVPFAGGASAPLWPVVTGHNAGLVSYEDTSSEIHGNAARRFGAPREGRHHAGVDLYGYEGDRVIATEPGIVFGIQGFHLGTDAILIGHDSGIVALYGEIAHGSAQAAGLQVGSRVQAGDTVGRVGCMAHDDGACSSHMVHFETYVAGTTKNSPWYVGQPVPPTLLDPTLYLLRAAMRAPMAASLPHRLRPLGDSETIPEVD